MGQLTKLISGTSAGNASRILRKRLTLTTILAVSPFLYSGRPAQSACVASPLPSYRCSGTNPGNIVISEDNAQVSTLASPPFVVDGGGLYITGAGDISFTDDNASSITNLTGPGLYVLSLGDVSPGVYGSLTISGDSTITGTRNGIFAKNLSGGDLSITANGAVTGLDPGNWDVASDGIYAFNTGRDLVITTGVQSVIAGDDNAIEARNYGTGNLEIKVQGQARSSDYDGIYARNGSKYDISPEAGDLKITIAAQAAVDGAGNGVKAQNYGQGDLAITVEGSVTGQGYDGLYAVNKGENLIITTGAASVVRGNAPPPDPEDPEATANSNGIDARNYGSGYLKIAADGVVFGNLNDAIYARNYGTNLTIETGAQSVIKGGGNGIGAYNYGDGNLTITANGVVGGYSDEGSGIKAVNRFGDFLKPGTDEWGYGYGVDLTITTGAASVVTGKSYGIDARNFGDGDLTIKAYGQVTGKTAEGIYALDGGEGGDVTIITGAGSSVTGAYNAITARNFGEGNLAITVAGAVTGNAGSGIVALNLSSQNLTIKTAAGSTVDAAFDGISAFNFGGGDTEVVVDGVLTSRNLRGIMASTQPSGEKLTITTGPGSVITAGTTGIEALHGGAGEFQVTVNGAVTGTNAVGLYARSVQTLVTIGIGAAGLVEGKTTGIFAQSAANQLIAITNEGIVRNRSQRAGDLALKTLGGAATIDNLGALVGTLQLTDLSDSLDNDGVWVTTGENLFGDGGGVDVLNNRGTLFGADDPTIEEKPVLNGLEAFNNDGGLISLVDGQVGDELRMNTAQYTSTNGRLAVDAVLGPDDGVPDELADVLLINGNAGGTTTKIRVNVVDATGANDGILVALVTGAADENSFALDGPLNGGFFTWGLQYELLDTGDHAYELYVTGTGVGASEFAAGMTGAQDLWFQTAGTLLQRQMDLRSLLGGTGVTPVADFAEPVAPTPIAKVTPGFWFSGLGAWLERDDEENGFTLDRRQTIWGGLAGFDFGTQEAGEAMLFGIFGGYLTSELDFKETNTEWTYEGPTLGAYATWLDRAFYVDATVKVDFLDVAIDPEDLAPDADDGDTDALNIGGRLDAGYRFGDSVFIEPQASLAVLYSEIDDVDVFGGTVAFDEGTSIRGRLGLRLGFDHQASDAIVYSGDVIASLWEDFSDDNNAAIATPGLPAFGVSDDPGATMGDISLGFAVASPDGWSGFLRGNYQFADDYDAYSGNVGIRYNW